MRSIPALPPVCILFISRFLTLQIEFRVFCPLIYSCITCFDCFSNCLLCFIQLVFSLLAHDLFCTQVSSVSLPMHGHTLIRVLLMLCSKRFFLFALSLVFYCLALWFFICFSWHCLRYNFCYLCCFPAAAISFFASIFATAVAAKILHSA